MIVQPHIMECLVNSKLGTLRNLSLNEIWDHEAADFSPWLVEEENLAKLSQTLGLELQLERREVPVGNYAADILAKDSSGAYVVIECQYNKTNHDHLGKLITYGATLNASILIWIAEIFSEEHKKAIQWLNDNTTEQLSIYAVQPELLQIDDSSPALRFTVISQPNEVVRAATAAKSGADLSDTQKLQLAFWIRFRDTLLSKRITTAPQAPRPASYFDVPLGRSNIYISNTFNPSEKKIGIRIYINNTARDQALEQLTREQDQIEREIGEHPQWNPDPESRAKIVLSQDIHSNDQSSWMANIEWLAEMNRKYIAAFKPRVQNLVFSDHASSEMHPPPAEV